MHRPFKLFPKFLISSLPRNSLLLLPGLLILASFQKMQGMHGSSNKDSKLVKTKKRKKIPKKKLKKSRSKEKKLVVKMQNKRQKMHV